MNKLKTRRDKIKLLAEIQSGKVSVSDFKPMVHQVWFQDRSDNEFYECHETGVRCTRGQIESFNPKGKNTLNIIVEYTRGYTIL